MVGINLLTHVSVSSGRIELLKFLFLPILLLNIFSFSILWADRIIEILGQVFHQIIGAMVSVSSGRIELLKSPSKRHTQIHICFSILWADRIIEILIGLLVLLVAALFQYPLGGSNY